MTEATEGDPYRGEETPRYLIACMTRMNLGLGKQSDLYQNVLIKMHPSEWLLSQARVVAQSRQSPDHTMKSWTHLTGGLNLPVLLGAWPLTQEQFETMSKFLPVDPYR